MLSADGGELHMLLTIRLGVGDLMISDHNRSWSHWQTHFQVNRRDCDIQCPLTSVSKLPITPLAMWCKQTSRVIKPVNNETWVTATYMQDEELVPKK